MILQINKEIELRQLQLPDAADIFHAIDSQRDYLGKWLPFVALTKAVSDTQSFVNSIVNAPEEKLEYVFTIRKQEQLVGLISFNSTDKTNKKTQIGYWLSEGFQG